MRIWPRNFLPFTFPSHDARSCYKDIQFSTCLSNKKSEHDMTWRFAFICSDSLNANSNGKRAKTFPLLPRSRLCLLDFRMKIWFNGRAVKLPRRIWFHKKMLEAIKTSNPVMTDLKLTRGNFSLRGFEVRRTTWMWAAKILWQAAKTLSLLEASCLLACQVLLSQKVFEFFKSPSMYRQLMGKGTKKLPHGRCCKFFSVQPRNKQIYDDNP